MSETKTLVAKYKCRNCEAVYLAPVQEQVNVTAPYVWITLNGKTYYAIKNGNHSCIDDEIGLSDLIGFRWI